MHHGGISSGRGRFHDADDEKLMMMMTLMMKADADDKRVFTNEKNAIDG